MADPIVPLTRGIKTGDGFINDVIANVVAICKDAFLFDERLVPFAPRYIYSCSPKKKALEEIPSLHVWCNKVIPSTPGVGGQTGNKLTTHCKFLVSIEYIYGEPDLEQSTTDMYTVAVALFDVLNQHHNLNGLANGPNEIFDVNVSEDFFALGSSVKYLNKVTIHAVYHLSYKKRTATR